MVLDPTVRFPAELPITASLDALATAIATHPVVIVAGETGSGKTTQLPKLCLAMGRGRRGRIGCTQPRRIAAQSVAARVAAELDTELGDVVGYQVRFSDKLRATSAVKFMTDGILLAELHGDPLLRRYDTIIIDEAHERSLNIDFLLGFVKRILPRRPDLRVIISSATLATERFARFFDDAPVVEVSGRTYPVEVLYRPPRPDEPDLIEVVANTVNEITELDPRGDVLVFLPGEREIREAIGALTERALPHTALLPLYARLSAAEQARVFQPGGPRRVILATNVAETSLTIPGIVYVVDAGLARLNRYAVRTGVTQLQIEPISQASANQRKGRCGRTADGVCFRLYDEADFASRPAYTDPELKRVGLAGVILRMKSLALGPIEDFPFLDPPGKRAIDEGYRVLEELGALDERGDLTALGHQLARLPVDPRLGRMILGGADQRALPEVLVIAAVLGLQDPRDRPMAARDRADAAHAKWRDEASDFASYLKLWAFWQDARKRTSRNQLARLCRDQFLSYPRMREWDDLHEQLRRTVRELDFPLDTPPASAEQVHRALVPALLSKLGMWHQESRSYLGARQTRFMIHPSSGLAKKPPPWVMAAELVETSQLFARTVARIDPTWLEQAAGPLCRRSYGHPHWEERQGQVMAREHVTLYGLPIVKDRRVAYGPIDPAAARELFILHALVRHEYATKGAFMANNRAVLDEVARLRAKARRGDPLSDEYALAEFFDRRLPPAIYSGKTFEAWRKTAEAADPTVLHLDLDDVLLDDAAALAPDRYPDALSVDGVTLPVAYRFEPSEDDDGATVLIPLAVLPQLDPERLAWSIPGWHAEQLEALLESLPKAIRRELVPLAPLAAQLAAELTPFSGPQRPLLERALRERTGVKVHRDAWDRRALPPYLTLGFRIVDEAGRALAFGRDLAELQRTLAPKAAELWARAPRASHERTGLTRWDFDELPAQVTLTVGGHRLTAYPALLDRETAVDLCLLESPTAAATATRAGLRRLVLLDLRTTPTKLEAQVPGALASGPLVVAGAAHTPRRQVVLRALDEAFALTDDDPLPRTRAEFAARLTAGRARLDPTLRALGERALALHAEVEKIRRLQRPLHGKPGHWRAALDDIDGQLAHLIPPELVRTVALARVEHLVRYLRAIQIRLERLALDPIKDQNKAAQVVPLWQRFHAELVARRARGRAHDELDEFGWLVEELRVAVFAPELRAAVPVSTQRLTELWATLAG